MVAAIVILKYHLSSSGDKKKKQNLNSTVHEAVILHLVKYKEKSTEAFQIKHFSN